MDTTNELPRLAFATSADWEAWLETHHFTANGVWLRLAKQGSGIATVSYAEALDVALCFGWIDGQKAPEDARFWRQKFTPRRPKSRWSQVNREKAEALVAAGKMRPTGLLQMTLAQADGRWDAAYASQRTITIPVDFQKVLDQDADALAFFRTLDNANRYAILYRLHTTASAEKRAARIEKFIAMLRNHETIHPLIGPKKTS